MKKSILKLSFASLFILTSCGNIENEKSIKGLTPVDVYLNFEKQGFTTEKQIGGEDGNLWVSRLNQDNIDFNVTTYSTDVNSVESVRATAIINLNNEIEAVKQFIKYTSTLPYENSNPTAASNWIELHFNDNGADTTIGSANLKISAPSKLLRQLDITKCKP